MARQEKDDSPWSSTGEKYVAYGYLTIVTVLFGWHMVDKIIKFSEVSETFPTWQLM